MSDEMRISPAQFVEKWRDRGLSERSSSQAHFIELCRMLDVPAPYDNRSDDGDYCFDAITATAGSRAYETAKRAGKSRERAVGKQRHQAALFGGGEAGGAYDRKRPILDALETIECRDAIVDGGEKIMTGAIPKDRTAGDRRGTQDGNLKAKTAL